MTDLSLAAYRFLNARPEVIQLVTEGVLGSDTKYPRWVFRDDDGKPVREIGESGKCAIVVAHSSTWALPNPHNTAHFPTLRIIIYADHTRDATGIIIKQDASDKLKKIYRVVDSILHDPAHKHTTWGDFRVHDCIGGSTLQIMEMPTYDGSVWAELRYNIISD